jgi:hypothetical protein
MPDIEKINAVAISDIEKLDAVLAANIEKVNGLVFSTAPAISAPAAAYSVRLLDTAVGVPTYTGSAMRVRRDTGGTGDDDEADIAFDTSLTDPAISLDSAISNASAGVTATTLGQFLNVGTVGGTTYTNPDSLTVTASCFVSRWMDQSGNANDAEQTAQGSQPQIHDGTVNTDLIQENGKPKLKAITQFFDTGISLSGTSWHFTAAKNDASKFVHYSNAGSPPFWAFGSPGSDPAHNGVTPTYYHNGVLMTSTSRADISIAFGSQALVSTTHSTAVASLRLGHSSSFPFASAHEFIIYNSDQSSNRTAIETDINDFFSIY